MTYVLLMPSIVIEGATARIEAVHVGPGDSLARGARLFDFSLDLGERYAQLCPPITYHRAVAHEEGRLLRFAAEPGAIFEANSELGLIGSLTAEAGGAPPSRAFRVVVAGIVWHEQMWSAGALA
jgi:hypothetical protein